MKNCFYIVCTTNTSMLENKTNLPEGGPTSCCIPFSRMLIFPSTGGRKTPDNTEQVDRRRRTGTEPAGRACAALRGGSSTGPPCSQFSQSTEPSAVSGPLCRMSLSLGALPPSSPCSCLPIPHGYLSLDTHFPGVGF